ncbi:MULTISPECIES: hypothetical protein [Bacillus cereus group]|uniref:Uncharacterized protein n=3 Tax=Bacillus cereus group TaxID=86661 RepID=A0A9W5R178_BACCE|nr:MULTISPECIES: hypothetical protein [Bacillus cereus group]PGR26222.1 hypothetical protein COC50_09940 [Bacillus anthracis]HDR4588637.1 hypothetical protein [Bacillus cytotoxicus]EOQ03720.1 hypothetical protein IKC_03849 [Bacillus cereus VD184]MBY0037835.1 hypothetical protein [Bacillus cereus]MDA2136817.1 hypothetical protein [Bacillus cereus group sp. Bc256]
MKDSQMIILKNIVLEQVRQDFAGVTEKIKTKLGVKLPTSLSWVITLLFQNTLILFFALLFEGITDPEIRNIVIVAVLLFNCFLPSAMARQNSIRVSNNPLYDLLWQSKFNRNQLLNSTLLAEVLVFWLHELMLEIIAFYVIIRISPDWFTGLIFCIGWFLLVSSIYFSKMKKLVLESWETSISVSKYTELFYILKIGIIASIIWFLTKLLFMPIIQEPITNDVYQQGIYKLFSFFSSRVEHIFKENLGMIFNYFQFSWLYYILGGLLILYIISAIYYFYFYSIQTHLVRHKNRVHLNQSTSKIFKFYQWLSEVLYKKHPWVKRDVIILERVIVNSNLPHRIFLFVPPAISALIGFTILLLGNLQSYSNFILAFWFIGWMVLSQTSWLWLLNYPILHPGSELRQVDLVKLSPHFTIQQFLNSKGKLLNIFAFPLQCCFTITLLIGFILLHGSIFELIVGILGMWLLFFINGGLSTYWMKLCSRFDYANMFMVRLDSYEAKFLQQFFTIPKRIINGLLFIVFFIGTFISAELSQQLIYDIFLIIVVLWGFSLYFVKK